MNNFNWNIITYESGANPYICKTQQELNRIKKKYAACIEQIGENHYHVNDVLSIGG